jgi:DNA repair exonuclease SbcCD ATPase subunit
LKQLEFLVERFGKDGYRAELIAHYIGTFEQSINDTLNAFGYECTLKFDPYQLMVVRNGVELPLQSLSKSQQFRFAIAFQVALSIHSGIGLVVIDETDMLDAEGRKALMRTVIATPELEQIICLGTDERTTFPHVDGLSVFYLHTDVDGATICQPLSQDTAA